MISRLLFCLFAKTYLWHFRTAQGDNVYLSIKGFFKPDQIWDHHVRYMELARECRWSLEYAPYETTILFPWK